MRTTPRRSWLIIVSCMGMASGALAAAGTASAAPGDVAVVSRTADGQLGDETTFQARMSDDGQTMVLATAADNLAAGATRTRPQVVLVDVAAGARRLVSASPSGEPANNSGASSPALSGDGRVVAFVSTATNLEPADPIFGADVYVSEAGGGLEVASVSSSGEPANGVSGQANLSRDGRFVTFASSSTNLDLRDTDPDYDIYIHDRATGTTELVSMSSDGVSADAPTYGIAPVSDDGRYVFFNTRASNLSPGGAPSGEMYRHDLQTGETVLATPALDGGPTEYGSFGFSASADGRFLAFASSAPDHVQGDTNGWSDVFVRDVERGVTTRVSVGRDGMQAEGRSDQVPVITPDGRYVVFTSFDDDIAPGEDSGLIELFIHDRRHDATARLGRGFAYYPNNLSISSDSRVVGYTSYDPAVSAYQQAYRFERPAWDEQPPDVELGVVPSSRSADPTPTFEFGSSDPDADFRCSLTTGADDWQPCVSPFTSSPLPDAVYHFRVRAVDPAGNRSDPVGVDFTIDTEGPETRLDTTPKAITSEDIATFEFSSEPGADFVCSLSPGGPQNSPCTSPTTYGPLEAGDYTFTVVATDATGNPGPASVHSFTVVEPTVDVASPSVPDLATASDTGLSSADDITSDRTPTFTGTATPGTVVRILVNGVERGSSAATSTGSYSVTTSLVPLGAASVTATAEDEDGHASQPSESLAVEVVPATACHTATNVITGTSAGNTLSGARLADQILGLGGNDTIDGKAAGDCLVGGTGSDQVGGSAGNDELYGDDGDDRLALGGGADRGLGGAGNDRVFANDNTADVVDCGAGGGDIATVDDIDEVIGCETVRIR